MSVRRHIICFNLLKSLGYVILLRGHEGVKGCPKNLCNTHKISCFWRVYIMFKIAKKKLLNKTTSGSIILTYLLRTAIIV